MGIEVRIVDREPVRSAAPHAVVMGSRTVELLEQRGLDQEMLRSGNQVAVGAVYGKGGLLGKVPITGPQSRHRYSLLVDHAEFEHAVRDELAQHGVAIEHTTKMIAFAQPERDPYGQRDDADVRCILRHYDGRLEDVTTPYLISADGTFSTVRQSLDLSSRIKPTGHGFVVADLRLDADLPSDEISIFLSRRGFLALFPMADRCFRCLVTDPQSSGARSEPTMEELQGIVGAFSAIPARLRYVSWSRRLPASLRIPPVFRHHRIFFGGDSAHAYRPATGQGIDPGIQDMINLSWKLVMVMRGQAAPELLQTYSEERLPVIRQVEKRVGFAADVLGSKNANAHQLVTRIAPTFLDSRFVLRLCADLAGEVIPDYRESSLSAPHRGPGGLQPGDYVPDIKVLAHDADALPRPAWLHELLDPSRPTLLLTAPAPAVAPHPVRHEQLGAC